MNKISVTFNLKHGFIHYLKVLIYNNIKVEKFNIPEENYDDLMYTFFSPDKDGWLQKQGGR